MSPHIYATSSASPAAAIRGRLSPDHVEMTANRRRLNRLAERDPAAILGVLDFWIGPRSDGDSLARGR